MKVTPDKIFDEDEYERFSKTLLIERKRSLSLLESEYKLRTIEKRTVLDSYMFEFMSCTGLRISETLKLEIKDVHEDFIIINAENSKNGKKDVVYFGERGQKIIKELFDFRLKYRAKGNFLFSLKEKPISRGYANQRFKLFLIKAKLKSHFSPHTLRHTYATRALDQGLGLPFVRDNLRHSSLQVTSVYLHMTRASRQRVKEVF